MTTKRKMPTRRGGNLRQAYAAGRSAAEYRKNQLLHAQQLAQTAAAAAAELAVALDDLEAVSAGEVSVFALRLNLLVEQLSPRASAGTAPGNESRTSQTVPPPAAAPSAAPAGIISTGEPPPGPSEEGSFSSAGSASVVAPVHEEPNALAGVQSPASGDAGRQPGGDNNRALLPLIGRPAGSFISHATVHCPARPTPAAVAVTGFSPAADDFSDVDQNDAD